MEEGLRQIFDKQLTMYAYEMAKQTSKQTQNISLFMLPCGHLPMQSYPLLTNNTHELIRILEFNDVRAESSKRSRITFSISKRPGMKHS